MEWDDCFILKATRILAKLKRNHWNISLLSSASSKRPPQKTLLPPHDLIITCTCKVSGILQRLEEQG